MKTLSKAGKRVAYGTRRAFRIRGKWYWYKKGATKWEYDGQMTPSEVSAWEEVQKKKEKMTEMKATSKERAEKLKKKQQAQQQQDDSGKPSQAALAKMSKRTQLYYDTQAVTDRSRRLANLTGVLCLDKGAEDYVERNLNDIFKLEAGQKAELSKIKANFPLDTDGKFLTDPVFVKDTIEKLKELRQQLKTDQGYYDSAFKKFEAWYKKNYGSSYNVGTLNDAFKQSMDEYERDLNNWIEGLELHGNDSIILGKIQNLESDMYGASYVMDSFVTSLPTALLPFWSEAAKKDKEYRAGNNHLKWSELTDEARSMLQSLGLNEVGYTDREQFTRADLETLMFAALTGTEDEFKPWFDGWEKKNPDGSVKFIDGGGNLRTAPYGKGGDAFKKGDNGYWNFYDFSKGARELREKYPAFSKFCTKMVDTIFRGQTETWESSGIADNISSTYGNNFGYVINGGAKWGELADLLKQAMKSKTLDFKTNTYEQFLTTAKAMGKDVFMGNSEEEIKKRVTKLHDVLSWMAKEQCLIDDNTIEAYTSHVLRKQNQAVKYGRFASFENKFYDYRYRGPKNEGLFKYREWRAHPKYISKQAYYKKTSEIGDASIPKNILKAKFMNGLASVSNKRGSYYAKVAKTHAGVSLAYAIGANYQLRKISRKSRIVPDWGWGVFKPFADNNPLPYAGFVNTDENAGITVFQDGIKNLRDNSIASIIGLKFGVKKGAEPQIVLRTNPEGIQKWQQKIDSSWTHGGAFGVGSVKVQNVFDIMYHPYFGDYKKIETSKGGVMYGYHGTDFEAGAKIIKGGYKIMSRAKAGRSLGDGIYIADSSSKSAGYLRGGTWGRYGHGVLLWNRIAAGKTSPGGGMYDRNTGDWDTIFAKAGNVGAFQYNEWCVKDPKAVVPIQWIEVKS